MTKHTTIRMRAAGLLAGFSLLLTGCFITPGKFTSELVLTQDEDLSFTFTYEGEIFFLGLSELAQMGAGAEEFESAGCYDEETYEERECTEEEIAEQRAQWEAEVEERAAKAKKDAEEMAALLGGIDPSDPEADAKLAKMLLRQKGWERVEPKGNGVFDISYSISSQLSHDFMFPFIEDVPATNPFVQMILRDDDVVRINAPGFAAQSGSNPMAGMGALAGLAAMGKEGGEGMPDIPAMEGTFTIVTVGGAKIRANNTDEGPNPTPTGEMLVWDITPATAAAPTALIDLSR